jgi:microcin C transport system substrate-binding protein
MSLLRAARTVTALALLAGLVASPLRAETQPAQGGIAMQGVPKYAADFTFEYVNPAAPKGGKLRLASRGSFNTLNQFVIKGDAAPGLDRLYQTLMENSEDEAFSEYGSVTATIEVPEDRSWVTFNLRPEAKWNDGKPITADDVVWTFNTLIAKGDPHFRAYYANVKKAEAEGPARVKFTFDGPGNRELPLVVGQLPVLPKHYWDGKDFGAQTLEPPLGSGPYRIKSVDPGHRIVFERVRDWWAKDLPINKGRYNFDTIVYDFYFSDTAMLQALFSGQYDVRQENTAKAWATAYDEKPVRDGLIKKEEIKNSLPAGMQAFVYNTRQPQFQDPKVREALGYAFDFEWSDKEFAYGKYKRTHSYFENSELASSGLPQGRELEILQAYKGNIPDEVFTKPFTLPVTDGSGNGIRENLTTAKKLLAEAGWHLGADGHLEKDGKPFVFELLTDSDVNERWISPFAANLKKLGITLNQRLVDESQYVERLRGFDFDMIIHHFDESLSPGNGQREFWGSEKADVRGSSNLVGIKNPVVDDLIQRLAYAKDREELIAVCHALDRVLLWNYYVIPQWYYDAFRIAYWDKFDRPAMTPKYGLGLIDTWWYDSDKAAKLPGAGKNGY